MDLLFAKNNKRYDGGSSSSSNISSIRIAMSILKIAEGVLLCVGFFSTLAMMKKVLLNNTPHYSLLCDVVVSFLNSLITMSRNVWSSPIFMCILINSMVALIIASSYFLHHKNRRPPPETLHQYNNDDNHHIYHQHPYGYYGDEHKVEEEEEIFTTTTCDTRDRPVPPSTPSLPREAVGSVIDNTLLQSEKSPPSSSTSSMTQQMFQDLESDDNSFQVNNGLLITISNTTETDTAYQSTNIEPQSPTKSSPSTTLVLREPLFSEAYACEVKRQAWALATYSTYSSSSDNPNMESADDNPPFPEDANVVEEETEEDDEDTLESTWKAITGGGEQGQPRKKKHLKKSETWDVPPQMRMASTSHHVRRLDSEEVVPSSPKWRELRKMMTFNDRASIQKRGGLIRHDPSVSIQEFNKKVEDFIKIRDSKELRLRRQESAKRFSTMIKGKLSIRS